MVDLRDAVQGAAVEAFDDDVLGHVGELAGEVAGVGGLEGGVGQALAGAVGGGEVLQHGEAFAEVGLDGGFDDFAGGLAIRPRMPASWRKLSTLPRALESAMRPMGLR